MRETKAVEMIRTAVRRFQEVRLRVNDRRLFTYAGDRINLSVVRRIKPYGYIITLSSKWSSDLGGIPFSGAQSGSRVFNSPFTIANWQLAIGNCE